MELGVILEVISTLGFPIALVIVLGWFIYKIYTDTTKQNAENMNAVQARCKEREEKLYNELQENRGIITKAIDTIAHYAEKLDVIQTDINEIKTDITILTAKKETQE